MKKKVVFVVTKSVWGGAQKYVYDLATNLPTDRFDVAVIAGGEGPFLQKLDDAGVRTIHIPKLDRDIHIGKELGLLFALYRIFRDKKPDIIHLNSSKVGGLGALAGRIAAWRAKKKIRIIFTVHGWSFFEDRSFLWRVAIFLASWISTLFQDKVVLINTADLRAARKFIPERKCVLIHNGLAPYTLIPQRESCGFLSKKTGREIPAKTLIIGTIAELTKNKGLNYLIDAINQICCHYRPPLARRVGSSGNPEHVTPGFPIRSGMTHRNNSDFKFLIIGEGEERSNLERQIHNLHLEDMVFLLGFIPDAAQYLSGMDIFVLPSLKEGLPYVIMEAMTVGLPIITSSVGGVPDLIVQHETGILVPPKNAEALTQAITMLAQNRGKRISLGNHAADEAKTKFSLYAMLEKTQQLYTDVK